MKPKRIKFKYVRNVDGALSKNRKWIIRADEAPIYDARKSTIENLDGFCKITKRTKRREIKKAASFNDFIIDYFKSLKSNKMYSAFINAGYVSGFVKRLNEYIEIMNTRKRQSKINNIIDV